MSDMKTSDSKTFDIVIEASAFYLPEHSDPAADDYFFGYTITIFNQSDETVQLIRRHWDIIDADGEKREIDGEGVVGEQPILPPGKEFRYQSFSNLSTHWGTMEGTYTMINDNGDQFEAPISRFYLVANIEEPAMS